MASAASIQAFETQPISAEQLVDILLECDESKTVQTDLGTTLVSVCEHPICGPITLINTVSQCAIVAPKEVVKRLAL